MTAKVEEWDVAAAGKKQRVEQARSSPVSGKATCLLIRCIIQGPILSLREQEVLL